MSIILNDNLDTQFNKPLDTRFGPYTDVATALTQVPAFRRYIGLTIGIGSNPVVEYWFNDGILDADFVIKTVDSVVEWGEIEGTLSNQTDLQNALNSKQDSLGFTPENVSNKSTTLDTDKLSNTKYPSVKSVYDWAIGLFATITQLGTKQDTLVSGTNIKTINSNTLLGSGDVVIDKSSVGLGNVANVDTTNATNITSGTLADARLTANVTTQGNTFNAANKLVQLDGTAKLPAVDGSQLTNLPSFSPPNGLLKLASAISTTFQVVKDYLDNASVLFLNSRRIGIGKDTSATTQSVAVVEVQDANTSIALKPNGTGGIIASVPDGTDTGGGNARGNGAVDLQLSRYNKVQVASGNFSFIGGGANNRATGVTSVCVGGDNNFSTGLRSFVGAGTNVSASGQDSVAVGGNTITCAATGATVSGGVSNNIPTSAAYSTVSGGQSNTASSNTHATVVGGQSNISSGVASISGGSFSSATGNNTIALGFQAIASNAEGISIHRGIASGVNSLALQHGTASGNYAFAATLGNASGPFSVAFARGNSYLQGQNSNSAGFFTVLGDAQQSMLTARREASLLTSAITVLSLDGTGTTNLIIPNGNNRAWNVTIDTIAVVTAITGTATGVNVGDCYRETKQLLFKRIGGTSSIVGTVDTSAIKSDSGMATASITISAGGSQQMAITFTAPNFVGGGSVTCRVVSKVSLVEVAY
jgi:hypothetical protein